MKHIGDAKILTSASNVNISKLYKNDTFTDINPIQKITVSLYHNKPT